MERKTINVAGVELELVSSPGETNDQLFVWYPAGKVLFAGDNFYRSFPNLYAIRGTPNLFRLSPKSESERVAKLAGGKEKLLEAAKDALATDDNQWAARLADHLLAINKNDFAAKQIKADALTKLARLDRLNGSWNLFRAPIRV